MAYDETEGDLPFLSNGAEEPGQWMAENAGNADTAKPRPASAPKQRKRRTYSANGPLTDAMRACVIVLGRWAGPMTENAVRELSLMMGGSRNARNTLMALEARGLVDHWRPGHKQTTLPFYAVWRGIWTLTPAGQKVYETLGVPDA